MIQSLLIRSRGEIAWPFIRTLPVVLNLFQDPCLEGGAELDGSNLAQNARHGC